MFYVTPPLRPARGIASQQYGDGVFQSLSALHMFFWQCSRKDETIEAVRRANQKWRMAETVKSKRRRQRCRSPKPALRIKCTEMLQAEQEQAECMARFRRCNVVRRRNRQVKSIRCPCPRWQAGRQSFAVQEGAGTGGAFRCQHQQTKRRRTFQ